MANQPRDPLLRRPWKGVPPRSIGGPPLPKQKPQSIPAAVGERPTGYTPLDAANADGGMLSDWVLDRLLDTFVRPGLRSRWTHGTGVPVPWIGTLPHGMDRTRRHAMISGGGVSPPGGSVLDKMALRALLPEEVALRAVPTVTGMRVRHGGNDGPEVSRGGGET